jgi:hypothetical protein
MPRKPLAESPHGPRFFHEVTREGDSRTFKVETSYEGWGREPWERLSPRQQQQAQFELMELHAARCQLMSLKPHWHEQAVKLLWVKGFGLDFGEYPEGRPDLAYPPARTIVIGWAIVESGYGFGEITSPRDEHPTLAAFEELGI